MAAKRFGPVEIIDIGSNSVRFVAYGGTARVPSSLFNEKDLAALGAGLSSTASSTRKSIGADPRGAVALSPARQGNGAAQVHTVATAAVRDASNGPAFMKGCGAGLKPRLLSERGGSRVVRARGDFGHPARARHRRRLWRGKPANSSGCRAATRGRGFRRCPACFGSGPEPDLATLEKAIRLPLKETRRPSPQALNPTVGGSGRLPCSTSTSPTPLHLGHVPAVSPAAALMKLAG